jgi:hypothetical protein
MGSSQDGRAGRGTSSLMAPSRCVAWIAWAASAAGGAGCYESTLETDATGDDDGVTDATDHSDAAEEAEATSPPETWVWRIHPRGPLVARGYGTAMTETDDGGVLLVGWAMTSEAGSTWMFRLDAEGDVVWDRLFIGMGAGWATAVARHPLGGYLIAGSATGATFIRIDESGTPLWLRKFAGTSSARALVPVGDGFIAAGLAPGASSDYRYPWLVRLDADGRPVWQKKVVAPGWLERRSVAMTRDGNFVVVAVLGEGFSRTALWLAKMTFDGAVLWQRRLPGISVPEIGAVSIRETADGDLVVTTTDDDPVMLVLRVDSAGQPRRGVRVGAGTGVRGGHAIGGADGTLIVAASEDSFTTEQWNLWLFGLSASGAITWQKSIPYDCLESAMDLIPSHDGGALALSGGDRCSTIVRLPLDVPPDATCEAMVDTGAVVEEFAFTSEEAALFVEDTAYEVMDGTTATEPAASMVEYLCD